MHSIQQLHSNSSSNSLRMSLQHLTGYMSTGKLHQQQVTSEVTDVHITGFSNSQKSSAK